MHPSPPPLELGNGARLAPAFRGFVNIGRRRLHLCHHGGFVTGAYLDGGECAELPRVCAPFPEAVMALVDHSGQVVSRTGTTSFGTGIIAGITAAIDKGSPVFSGGARIEVSRLSAPGREDWVVRVTPCHPTLVPQFASLTEAQLEVCLLASTGMGLRDVARHRGCATETARSHLRSAYKALGVGSRAELVPVVMEHAQWVTALSRAS